MACRARRRRIERRESAVIESAPSPFVSGSALLDLGGRASILRVRGKDASAYLQRQVSADLRKITPARGIRSTLMTRKGKLVALFEIHAERAGGFLIAGDEPGIAALHRALGALVILAEVTIEGGADAGSLLSVQGPTAEAVLARALGASALPREEREQAEVTVDGEKLLILRSRRSAAGGWDLAVAAAAKEAIAARILQAGAQAVDEAAMEAARIAARIPRFGADTDENSLPPECGYDDAVSYDKGCYVGQEIVARIRTYGHVNRILRALDFEEERPPPRGAALEIGGAEAGTITSSAVSPASGRAVALGYVRFKHSEPGTGVRVHVESGVWIGTIAALAGESRSS